MLLQLRMLRLDLLRQPYLVHHFGELRVGAYGVESEVSCQAL